MATRLKIGQRARDTISGFEGIVYGITEYLHGCRHICIKPTGLDKDGAPQKVQWIDEPQCEIVQAATALEQSGDTGGPKEDNYRKM